MEGGFGMQASTTWGIDAEIIKRSEEDVEDLEQWSSQR